MYIVIFTILLFLIFTLSICLGLLFGKKYLWYYSLTRLSIVILSGLSSFFLSKLCARLCGNLLYSTVTGILPNSIMDYINEVESAPDVVGALIAVIVAPIIFLAVFLIFRAVLNLITKIVFISVAKSKNTKAANVTDERSDETTNKEIPEGHAKKVKKPKAIDLIRIKGVKNPIGMTCGAICGLLLFLTVSMPILGGAYLLNGVTQTLSNIFPDNNIYSTASKITDASVNNPISKAVSFVGAKPAFNALTSTQMGDHTLSLTKEIDLLTTTGNAVYAFFNDTVPREEAAAEIRKVAPAFKDSTLIPTIAPDIFSSADESWRHGEDFHGIKKPTPTGTAQIIVEPVLNTVVKTDYNTIKVDVSTFVEIFALLTENDAVNLITSDPLSIPKNEEMTASIIYNLLENEHLIPMVGSMTEEGIRIMGEELHIHAHKDALYNEFAESAATDITEALSTKSTDNMSSVYTKLFDNYGIDITEDSAVLLANKSALIFSQGIAEPHEIKALLGQTALTLKDGRTVTIDSADILSAESLLVCMDEIHVDISRVDDNEQESKALSKAMHEAVALVSIVRDGSFGNSESIQKFGPILDALSATKTIGTEDTERILLGIFQSDLIHDKLGFTLVDATDVAKTLCEKSHRVGYTPLLKSIATTIDVVQSANDNSVSKEEFNAKIEVLIEDLNTDTTEVLQKISTPEVVSKKGVPEKSAKPTADLISNVLGNLNDAKENGMSDEQYKSESEATGNLLKVALSSNSSKKDNIFASADASEESNEESAVSMTAAEYVDSVLNSSVISQTIIETVYVDGSDEPTHNPLNISKPLSEKDQTSLIAALNTRWQEASEAEKTDSDYFKTYVAIGSMINLAIEVDTNGVIVPSTK